MYNTKKFYLAIFIAPVLLLNSGCAFLLPVAATGTAGIVAFDERSSGKIVDDAVIITKIKTEFSKNNANNLLTKISVNAYEGRIMLTGVLKEQEYADEAVRRAWRVSGVKEVISELVISESPKNKAEDVWISSQIKTKFLLERRLDSLNYKYDVNDSIVYLLGVAQNNEELERVISICRGIKNVEKVVNYVILKTDQRREKNTM